ncbi:MAG: carboxypeptidase regulatory-like domain-containing protein [bacterium]|nr:carboxypeptidase regulatory-like domain-containing protein [bacterium]
MRKLAYSIVTVVIGAALWWATGTSPNTSLEPEHPSEELAVSGERTASPSASDGAADGPSRTPLATATPPAASGRSTAVAPEFDGTVVDNRGRPVAGAVVAVGGAETRSGPGGTFDLPASADPAAGVVVAKLGYAPLVLGADERLALTEKVTGGGMRFTLRAPAHELDGSVVDKHGSPLAGWFVELANPHRLDADAPTTAEGLAGYEPQTTGADGKFRLNGLAARTYRVRATQAEEGREMESQLLAAGTLGFELRQGRDTIVPAIEGVVAGLDGRAIGGARVQLVDGLDRARREASPSTTTDAGGRFRLERVSARAMRVRVTARGFVALDADVIGPLNLDYRLARKYDIELLRSSTGRVAHKVALLDHRGLPLDFVAKGGRRREVTLLQGRSQSLAVPETARTLVLRDRDGEVWQVSLTLVNGRRTVVRY